MISKALIMSKFLLSLFFLLSTAFAHDHDPGRNVDANYSSNYVKGTLFKRVNSFKLKLEAQKGEHYQNQSHSQLLLGTYYLLPSAQRIGFFFAENTGLRHTNDWVFENNEWRWNDTSQRKEYLSQFVYTKKFTPHTKTPIVYELINTYQTNSFNGQSSFIFQPNMHYFIFSKGQPKFSFRLSVPLYYALNFDQRSIYKQGLYLGSIYHINRHYMIALGLKQTTEKWVASTDSIEKRPSQDYAFEETIGQIGLEFIISL